MKREGIQLKVGNHRPANETPFKWRFVGGSMVAPTLNADWVDLLFSRRSELIFLSKPIAL